MKKLILTILLFAFALSFGQTNSTEPSGAGTEADPYQITSLSNLSWLTQNEAENKAFGYYAQTTDIDASETATWDDSDDNGDGDRYNDPNDLTTDGNNDGWLPLGTVAGTATSENSYFSGNYNGNDYAIDGLAIVNRSSFFPSGYGFVRSADSLEITNLSLTNVNFNGNSYAGGLVGRSKALTIKKCSVSGVITQTGAGEIVGGLTGRALGGVFIIEDSFTDVEIHTDDISYVAGFACYIDEAAEGSYITRCFSLGDVTGDSTYTVGGFIAKHEASNCVVSECYSTGNVIAGKRIGGFIAMNKDAVIKDCYNISDVTVHSVDKLQESGVFCGYNKKVSIENSYTVGKIIFDNGLDTTITDRGFVGRHYYKSGKTPAKGIACFFDSTLSNQKSDSFAVPTSTAGMKTESTYTDSSWDFTSVWEISNNYPNLINNSNPDLKPLEVVNSVEPAGAGTEADPYQIAVLGNLSWLTQNYAGWNKFYIQVADVNAAATKYWDDSDDNADGDKYNDPNDITDEGTNDGWLPIQLFNGSYNGDEFVVDNLTINRSSVTSGVGFFQVISGGKIENFGLTNVNIMGKVLVGVLAATCKENTVTNCYTTGTMTLTTTEKSYKFGGFFANIISGISEISNCHSEVNIIATPFSYYIGGFVGNVKGVPFGSIIDCYATGNITNGGQACGGFIAKNEAIEFELTKSYSTGNVTAAERSGGFVAYNKGGADGGPVISDCYSLGDVTCTSEEETRFGAFCGYNSKATIQNSYSIGSVTFTNATDSTDTTGVGFTGQNKGTVTDCFFDKTVSNQDSSAEAIGKTTSEMMAEATFTDAGWDFTNIWEIEGSNYPTIINTTVSVEKDIVTEIPSDFALQQNYPNPFNPTTVIDFALPKATNVTLSIYNVIGEKVTELVNGKMAAGHHTVNFNASNLASGMYIYRISAGNFVATKKMMLLK